MVAREKIIFPTLRIKLGLMKVLDRDGLCFGYMTRTFSGISTDKLKAGIFDVPQMRKLIKDPQFTATMNEIESNASRSFAYYYYLKKEKKNKNKICSWKCFNFEEFSKDVRPGNLTKESPRTKRTQSRELPLQFSSTSRRLNSGN